MTNTIRIGEIRIARAGQTLCSLLGSCVGIVIHDPENSKAGFAHVHLPDSTDSQDNELGKYADTAVPEILRQLGATDRKHLVAHLAGGSDMFPLTKASLSVGTLNVQAAEASLAKHDLKIGSRHCGGTRGRRVNFDIDAGVLSVVMLAAPNSSETLAQRSDS